MKPELLAPAGSPEALRAAVQNGADAVYLGWGEFNARRGAKTSPIRNLRMLWSTATSGASGSI